MSGTNDYSDLARLVKPISDDERFDLQQSTGMGDPSRAMLYAMSGIDHRMAGTPYQTETTLQGYYFIQRPMLNLNGGNLVASDVLSQLVDTTGEQHVRNAIPGKSGLGVRGGKGSASKYSPFLYIRDILDVTRGTELTPWPTASALVDDWQPFIPLLTNTCVAATGWPDKTLDSYSSPEGKRRQSWGMVDSVNEVNAPFDLTTSFRNIEGNMLHTLFSVWGEYMGRAYMGEVVPHDFVLNNYFLDYGVNHWRITVDNTLQHVVDIGCAFCCWPIVDPTASRLNFNRDEPYIAADNTVDIQWRCHGFEVNTPRLMKEFNDKIAWLAGVGYANGKAMSYTDLKKENFARVLPHINLNNSKLEWVKM